MVSGLLVGWSVNNGVVDFLIGVGLLIVFAFTMSWVGIWLGLSVPTVEVGQQVAFVVIFPITFISSAFVPIQTHAHLAPAVRGMEPGEHAHHFAAHPVGQSQPVRDQQPAVAAADPGDHRLGRGPAGPVRAPRRSQVPLHQPLACPVPRVPWGLAGSPPLVSSCAVRVLHHQRTDPA